MTAKEQVIKSIEDWYQPVKISELIHERKSNMSAHKDKIRRYITDWSCELKRNNKGRRKSADAIKTINTRVKRLKEIGCPDRAIEVLIAFRDRIVRNGCANYNKMSLRKVVKKAREIYKDIIEHPKAKRNKIKKVVDKITEVKYDAPEKKEHNLFRVGPFHIQYTNCPTIACAKCRIDNSVFSVDVARVDNDEHHCVMAMHRNGKLLASMETYFGKSTAFHCAVGFMKRYICDLASGHGKGRGSWIKAKIAKYESETESNS